VDSISQPFVGQAIIVGAGLAGLMTALHLAPEPVIVLTKAPIGSAAATPWAQGGIAAALGPDDSAALHARDTIASGDGLCDPQAVNAVTFAARAAVEQLIRYGAMFDRAAGGAFRLGLEAAHSRRRIVHARGDGTGHEILRALTAAVRQTSSITVLEGVDARRLFIHDGRLAGILALARGGPLLMPSSRVIIATGGVGGLYRATTNPLGAVGQGLALAARAGAALIDMEFVQFHPTALDAGIDPMPLVSEAVRGEGAVLVDDTGERFMANDGRAELEPRDVVARAVWRRLAAGHHVLLDARAALGAGFAARFPNITAACQAAGIDPATTPIPVRPAAHYHMGGITVDGAGRTSIEGLWACGEAAATGLHGANRLASNSLLEAAVCARWVAESVAGTTARRGAKMPPAAVPLASDTGPVRNFMSRHVGVLRNRHGLRAAIAALHPVAFGTGAAADAAAVGLMIATAALLREESRGSHLRTDFPRPSPRANRITLRLGAGDVIARSVPAASPALVVGV
jgi:L-aspartate oxidase